MSTQIVTCIILYILQLSCLREFTLLRLQKITLVDSRHFEQIQLKMAWSKKNIYFLRSIPHKMFWNYVLLKVFIKKCCFRRFFNQKVRASTSLWLFLCISAGRQSHMTLRRPIGVQALNESPPLVVWESYLTPSRTATHFLSPSRLGLNKVRRGGWLLHPFVIPCQISVRIQPFSTWPANIVYSITKREFGVVYLVFSWRLEFWHSNRESNRGIQIF
jgi:hypothetical protein